MAPSTSTAASTTTSSGAPVEGVRRRSLSGASALLARRFTRNTASASPSSSSAAEPRPTASKSESTAKRRATIASSASSTLDQNTVDKVHVRIVPNIDNPSRSLIFDIVDRQLQVGSIIRIGRYSERHANLNCMSFKSKVVSRCHCEVWVQTDGKLYIRDTKSSSGTFLNHVRLSPAGNESRPVELHDGDIVQLGVDFQGGREEMYRSVKMRFELNRSSRQRPLSFNLNAFQNLRNLTQAAAPTPPLPSQHQHQEEGTNLRNTIIDTSTNNLINSPPASDNNQLEKLTDMQTNNDTTVATTTTNCHDDVDECCICLYALAPFQALFVSPCSHTYHFKCIRPLLQSYPGFQCPICRTYSDLEASVATEADEVIDICRTGSNSNKNHERSNTVTTAPPADSGLSLQSPESSDIALHNPLHVTDPYSTTFVSSPVIYSETLPDPFSSSASSSSSSSPANQNHTAEILQHVIEESAPHAPSPQAPIETEQVDDEDHGVLSNTEDEEDDIEVEDVDMSNLSSAEPTTTQVSSRATSTSTPAIPKRERRSSHIMDKLKMVFFEKRKSASTSQQQQNKQSRHSHKKRARPLSYPNLLSVAADEQPPSLPPHAENQQPLLQLQGH
ncbi:unnamed protein product [Mucor circinelloides]